MNNTPRVLLVDDEPLILSSYRRSLRTIDAELILAEDPTYALDLMTDDRPPPRDRSHRHQHDGERRPTRRGLPFPDEAL